MDRLNLLIQVVGVLCALLAVLTLAIYRVRRARSRTVSRRQTDSMGTNVTHARTKTKEGTGISPYWFI
jgi:hypothetical protein